MKFDEFIVAYAQDVHDFGPEGAKLWWEYHTGRNWCVLNNSIPLGEEATFRRRETPREDPHKGMRKLWLEDKKTYKYPTHMWERNAGNGWKQCKSAPSFHPSVGFRRKSVNDYNSYLIHVQAKPIRPEFDFQKLVNGKWIDSSEPIEEFDPLYRRKNASELD